MICSPKYCAVCSHLFSHKLSVFCCRAYVGSLWIFRWSCGLATDRNCQDPYALVRIRGYGIIKTALSCHTAGNRIWHNGVAPPTPPLAFSANLAADGRAQCCNVVALTGVWRVVSGERRYLYEAIRRDDTDMPHDIAAATANIETHATENKQRNFIHLYYRSALTV